MKKGLIAFSLLGLIMISSILAYQSEITIITTPNTEITLRALNYETGKMLSNGVFNGISDDSGKLTFKYNLEEILLGMSIVPEDKPEGFTFPCGQRTIFLDNVILDKKVIIDLNQNPIVPVTSCGDASENQVIEDKEVTEELTTENETFGDMVKVEEETQVQTEQGILTGAVVSDAKGIFKSVRTYMILGGVLGLFLVFVMVHRMMGIKKQPENYKVTKLSERNEMKEGAMNSEERLANAERKLLEAKQEIDEIKNKKAKLREAQEKYNRDKEELRRLQEERDF